MKIVQLTFFLVRIGFAVKVVEQIEHNYILYSEYESHREWIFAVVNQQGGQRMETKERELGLKTKEKRSL